MNKNTFIITLRERLKGLPSEDIDKSVDYYCELIEDRIEEGESEEEAIATLGSIDEIVQKILADTPLTKLVKTKIEHKNQTSLWVIILIILGIPVWVPIIISLAATIFALYISLWAVVIAVFAACVGIAISGIAGIVTAIIFIAKGLFLSGVALLGSCLVLIGICILLAILSHYFIKLTVFLTKKTVMGIKKLFIGKGEK